MRRKRLTSMLAIAVAAGALLAAGCASPAAKAPAASGLGSSCPGGGRHLHG
jgi:outer membrane murein-binding lipoprotein Lpp